MQEEKNHSARLGILLVALVLTLLVVSVEQYVGGDDASSQQAAVLGVYEAK